MIVGEESRATFSKGGRELNRVRSLQTGEGSQMGSRS